MKPRVFVEGGGPPPEASLPRTPSAIENLSSAGIDGRFELQQAFYQLFKKAVPSLDVLFDITMSGGWQETVKQFALVSAKNPDLLTLALIDYQDIVGENRVRKEQKIEQLVTTYQSTGSQRNIIVGERLYFMIQKMDAWLLSQPDIIETEFSTATAHKDAPKFTEKTGRYAKQPPDQLTDPDDKMADLLGCFEEEKKGKWRKIKYHKIQTVARLLPRLDLDRLQRDFEDVRRFVAFIRTL